MLVEIHMAPRPGTRATRTQSALARAHRGAHPDAAHIEAMQRQLDVDRLADRLDEIAARWPAISAGQKANLSVLLSAIPAEQEAEAG